jgi:hypothetical protein
MRFPLFLVLLAVVTGQAVDPPPSAQVDSLSVHRTDAVYEGVRHLPCRHRTALCPDKCGHARDVAVFRITAYREYVKDNSHHGDPKAVEFLLPLKEGEEVSADILAFARALKAGDTVRLDWVHEYVRSQGASYPRRRVTQLAR